MTTQAEAARLTTQSDLAPAYAAVRARLGLVALLLALAAIAWWSTAHRMAGMDAGPGTDLGALGWFLGVWVVMMVAMMLPSLAPTAALYAGISGPRGWTRALLFTGGYLLVWGLAGSGRPGTPHPERRTAHHALDEVDVLALLGDRYRC